MNGGVVACFTPEVAIDQSLHTYSGGLGVVEGSFLRSCYRLGLPVVGVTLLPRQGYYDQGLDREEGAMTVTYVNRSYEGILQRTGTIVTILIAGAPVRVEAWELPAGRFDSVPIYFLDVDIEGNDELSRLNTMQLYGGNMERIIGQSLVLGRGGLAVLRALNISVGLYHLNESYGIFALMDMLSDAVRDGMDREQALALVRSQSVFTTHTPVSAGNPDYDLDAIMRMTGYDKTLGWELVRRLGGGFSFNATAASLQLCGRANAVSRKHMYTARRQWAWVQESPQLSYITNGKDPAFWQDPACREARTPESLQRAKYACNQRMLKFIQERFALSFDLSDMYTLVWARRLDAYKRPELFFEDMAWVRQRLKNVRCIFSGKPHPNNKGMIEAWNRIYQRSLVVENLIVLPGYDLELMQILQAGAHSVINTPRVPLEACGSSGMGNAQNGGIHISTPDGWAAEQDSEANLIFGTQHPMPDQDAFDATSLQRIIDYASWIYQMDPAEWWAKALRAKQEAETQWSSDRMAGEYAKVLYAIR